MRQVTSDDVTPRPCLLGGIGTGPKTSYGALCELKRRNDRGRERRASGGVPSWSLATTRMRACRCRPLAAFSRRPGRKKKKSGLHRPPAEPRTDRLALRRAAGIAAHRRPRSLGSFREGSARLRGAWSLSVCDVARDCSEGRGLQLLCFGFVLTNHEVSKGLGRQSKVSNQQQSRVASIELRTF